MFGLIQYLMELLSCGSRWMRVTRAPAQNNSREAIAAEFFPPITATSISQ